ncbi:uncharacterized protein FIBRA_03816 [Fibroporia radiculosa]|uniref:Uncharacterized protein n=1 Tax=Fibroporia radiculosa TaxID=599839 RepID=J4GNP5_9APHY|nr:uncharacterized protein FIBRA_03816 [Fibroporia radiculosa]CCM01750.1 predicted protein [Fibroporia radiculosa]
MAANTQVASQGAVKKTVGKGKVAPSRYLNPTSASTSRATAVTGSSSKIGPTVPSSVKGKAIAPALYTSKDNPSSTSIREYESVTTKRVVARAARKDLGSSRGISEKTSTNNRNRFPISASASSSVPVQATSREKLDNDASLQPEALYLAAQTYSWLYMTSTLENRFDNSKKAASDALESRSRELASEEADIADARTRFVSERLLDFYEELSDVKLSGAVPSVVQAYLKVERTYSTTISEAVSLATQSHDEYTDIRVYARVLDHIDCLQQEVETVESFILTATDVQLHARERPRALQALRELLPVIRAQADNLNSPSTPASSSTSRKHVLLGDAFTSNHKGSGFATVAAQGDGIHILDLSTLHPAISHTLGPNTTFSCPPVTQTSRRNGVDICTTFAVVESSPDVLQKEGGRTVWKWEEQLSGGVMSGDAQKKKKSALVPHALSRIYVCDDLPDKLLLVDRRGEISLSDMDLSPENLIFPITQRNAQTTLYKHFVFPRKSCTFMSSGSMLGGVVAAFLWRESDQMKVSVTSVDTHSGPTSEGECILPLTEADIVDASFSASGCITVLTCSGTWRSFQLSESATSSESFSLRPLSEPIHLAALSFLSAITSTEISLLALTSSHVLLSGISTSPGSSPEITLLIWDMQYGVLLSEQRCGVPSTLGRLKPKCIQMHLAAVPPTESQSQALLVLSPSTDRPAKRVDSKSNILHSSILVVPYTVPLTSTIARALGRASASTKYLKLNSEQKGLSGYHKFFNTAQAKLLKSVQHAMNTATNADVERVFEEWVADEEQRASAQFGGNVVRQNEEHLLPLGHLFVKQLLDIVLPASTSGNTSSTKLPHAPKVVRYLLERRVVSDCMIEGGLIPALLLRHDWESAVLAVQKVIDLPEMDITSLLAQVVAQRRQVQTDNDAMQVDSPAGMPTLPSFLSLFVHYPTSPATLRIALRRHLADADDLTHVLSILDGWVEQWCREDVRLLPDGVKKDAHGVQVPFYTERKQEGLPSLDKILNFAQSIFDASFLTLLSYPPAHVLIRTLLTRLRQELALISELQVLHGPLRPFAWAHTRAVHEGIHGPAKVDTSIDWRRRKKLAHEQAEMSVRQYQVEELVI